MKDRIGEKPAPEPLRIVQAFINTAASGREDLASPDCLREWLTSHDLIAEEASLSSADLQQAVTVRNALVQLAIARQDGRFDSTAIETLNRAARSAQMSVSFGPTGRAAIEPLAPAVDGALGKIIAIVVDATTDGTWDRLKICRDAGCSWAFYDRSKNHSGAWCDISSCGNVAKARTYRARHQAKAGR
jgi:predicted RNA-binding Zn ribbon-like protein